MACDKQAWVQVLFYSQGRASASTYDKRTGMGIRPTTVIVKTARMVGVAAGASLAAKQTAKDAWQSADHTTIDDHVGIS
jgi:hypothetical protein